MKRFRLRQEVSLTEEDGAPVKEFSVDMWISTEGMDDTLVKDMFSAISAGFTNLLEEASFEKDKDEEMEFMLDDMQKRW